MRACLLTAIVSACLFTYSSKLIANSPLDEHLRKRIHAHLVVRDYETACTEAFLGLRSYPESKAIWLAYLRALAKAKDERVLIANWRLFVKKFPEEVSNRDMLEAQAWAIIENGANSASPAIRVIAMLGAYFSQDAKGVAILQKGLRDKNSFLRTAALKLASQLQDACIQDEVLRLFKSEKVWSVRLEAIRTIGQLSIESSREMLVDIIGNKSSLAEEKVAAIEALVAMSDELERVRIEQFVRSDRAGLRLLACELVAHFEQVQDVDLLLPLIGDRHAEVRAAVFEVLGRLRIKVIGDVSVFEIAARRVGDPEPLVAVTAAWVMMLLDPGKGAVAFEPFLHHEIREVRHLAAAALAASGKYGIPLACQFFKTHIDPYVRLNLAIGMIGQRNQTMQAADSIYETLTHQKDRLMWREEGTFHILAPSTVKHDDETANYPEAINQLVRLNMLEILAMVDYPKALQAVKSFLQEHQLGVSGMASALLLTEGDESAVDLVRALLKDKERKVRTQAALILALWGKDEEAISFLKEAYNSADKELKGQILEGIGRAGTASALLFLADKLQEPHQTLRIIAAAALLECLYH